MTTTDYTHVHHRSHCARPHVSLDSEVSLSRALDQSRRYAKEASLSHNKKPNNVNQTNTCHFVPNESTKQLHGPFHQASRPHRRWPTGHRPPRHEPWDYPILQRWKQSRQSCSYNGSPFTQSVQVLRRSYRTPQSPRRHGSRRKDGSGGRYA